MHENWNLPAFVFELMEKLRASGHRGYLVGGSLRDLLRGVTPHDFDMTTDATPEEMLEIFAAYRVIETGLRHGTLTVLCDGEPVELTTHRVDGAYLDARRPESVSFTRRLADDLSRRDFTVNAMAWNPEVGLVDLFGGQEDLARGILRAVGDPATRFGEDALRILRAFRFSAQLGFEIEPATLDGARQMAAGLAKISVERIYAELTRLLEAPHAEAGLAALFAAACEPYVFLDAAPFLVREVRIEALPPVAALRAAALLPALPPERARAFGRALHAPNAFGEGLALYLAAAAEPLPQTSFEARRFVCRYWAHFEGGLALAGLRGEDVQQALALCRRVAKDGTAVELRRLAVGGRELQEICGVQPRRTAEMLQRLQELVWQEPASNKKAALLEAARAICERERDFLA